MTLQGSCHCGAVGFSIDTDYVYPLSLCFCGRCRKVNGSPVSAYLKGKRSALRFTSGQDRARTYRVATNERVFCGECGSSLVYFDSRWPEDCWPLASAMDTPLSAPPQFEHIFVGSRATWYPIATPGPRFDEFSDESIEGWHRLWGLI